jgi:succinate-semialdehyde dehydrogenase/glutarate-semialdehyde dehydrogenase
MTLISRNPATLEVISEVAELTPAHIEDRIATAAAAYTSWRTTTFAERSILLKRAAEQLRAKKDVLAELITNEVGKTLAASHAEVEKCALVCEYYADHAETILTAEVIHTGALESYVRFDPLGIILAVMPWNFPLWQVFRFAAPALMAGNVCLLKHASNVQGSALAIEKIFSDAGFPDGAFYNLAIGAAKVASVIEDPRVQAITLTGSEKAGSSVAALAGKLIKKTVLELGGSDPFIVCADADIAKAATVAVSARMQANAGQSCISAKRFIVHTSVEKEFTKLLVAAIEKLQIGDPHDPKTDVGPLTNEQMLTDIERQVKESVKQGAQVQTGGNRLERVGYFYQPTVLSRVKKGMPVYDEEVFGPVLPVITFATEEEAVQIANSSPYGLGATIFSNDIARAKQLATNIESGSVFINSQVRSDPRLPFGGIKRSGYGRELAHYGIKEFVNIKTVSVSE